jgi:hypothetical protein
METAKEDTMWRMLSLALPMLLLAGCATQPAFQDAEARQFYSVPGKSVIYIVREKPDRHPHPTVVTLDHGTEGLTYPGTFLRWEVAPGAHRIAGFGGDAGAIQLDTEPGKIYFIRQTVMPVNNLMQSQFNALSEQDGRAAVARSPYLASL